MNTSNGLTLRDIIHNDNIRVHMATSEVSLTIYTLGVSKIHTQGFHQLVRKKFKDFLQCSQESIYTMFGNIIPVSYTHLTLPTNREV